MGVSPRKSSAENLSLSHTWRMSLGGTFSTVLSRLQKCSWWGESGVSRSSPAPLPAPAPPPRGAPRLARQDAEPLGRQVLEGEDKTPVEGPVALQRAVMDVRPLPLLLQPVQPPAVPPRGGDTAITPVPSPAVTSPGGRGGGLGSPGDVDIAHPLPHQVDVLQVHVLRVPDHAAQLIPRWGRRGRVTSCPGDVPVPPPSPGDRPGAHLWGLRGVMSTGGPGGPRLAGKMSTHICTLPCTVWGGAGISTPGSPRHHPPCPWGSPSPQGPSVAMSSSPRCPHHPRVPPWPCPHHPAVPITPGSLLSLPHPLPQHPSLPRGPCHPKVPIVPLASPVLQGPLPLGSIPNHVSITPGSLSPQSPHCPRVPVTPRSPSSPWHPLYRKVPITLKSLSPQGP